MEALERGVYLAVGFILYFLPTFMAYHRRHSQIAPIFTINFFLGWTFVGWVVALAWSVSVERR